MTTTDAATKPTWRGVGRNRQRGPCNLADSDGLVAEYQVANTHNAFEAMLFDNDVDVVNRKKFVVTFP